MEDQITVSMTFPVSGCGRLTGSSIGVLLAVQGPRHSRSDVGLGDRVLWWGVELTSRSTCRLDIQRGTDLVEPSRRI